MVKFLNDTKNMNGPNDTANTVITRKPSFMRFTNNKSHKLTPIQFFLAEKKNDVHQYYGKTRSINNIVVLTVTTLFKTITS